MSGMIELTDSMPRIESDADCRDAFIPRIARSARESLLLKERVSNGEIPSSTWENDERLVRYLAKSDPMHSSPFEHVTLSFEMTAPLAVAVHVFRHRTFSYNAFSHRYANALHAPCYMPPRQAIRGQTAMNKQASGEMLGTEQIDACLQELAAAYENSLRSYQRLIELGLARERARFVLPEGMLTGWVMTGNLLNFARFLRTRGALDLAFESPVQEETRSLAAAMHSIMHAVAPITMNILDEYVVGAKMVPMSKVDGIRGWLPAR
jgi:thymidylate synthase (FAD)